MKQPQPRPRPMPSVNLFAPPREPPGKPVDDDRALLGRRHLIPLWIRGFSWVFLIMGVASPLAVTFGNFKAEFLGLAAAGGTPLAYGISALFAAFGVAAYGLLFGKRWGVDAGLAAGVVGGVIACYSMVQVAMMGGFQLRLELLFQIPFILQLASIRKRWRAAAED